MSNYPAAIANEICELFQSAHPRGWALVCEAFGIRFETAVNIFRFDQKLWYHFKRLVKSCQKVSADRLKSGCSRSGIEWLLHQPGPWRDFWQYFRQFNQVVTDDLDYLTFVKYDKPV